MKTVEFIVSDCKSDRYHYECSDIGDMSGLYYNANDVNKRLDALKEYFGIEAVAKALKGI